MPSFSGRTTRKWYPCSTCSRKRPLLLPKKCDRTLYSYYIDESVLASNSIWIYRPFGTSSSTFTTSSLRHCFYFPFLHLRNPYLLRLLTYQYRWRSSLSNTDPPPVGSSDHPSASDKASIAPSTRIYESHAFQDEKSYNPSNQYDDSVPSGWPGEKGASVDDWSEIDDMHPPPRALRQHNKDDVNVGNSDAMEQLPPLGQSSQPQSVIPPFISRELTQLRQHLQQVMTVLDGNKIDSNGSNPFPRPTQPVLPPLSHSSIDVGAPLSIQDFLSLPHSAWDDAVWTQARALFAERFHLHCIHFLEPTHHNMTSKDVDLHSRKNADVTVEDMQETMNLLLCICQTRPHTRLLDSLMYNFFTEVRATFELLKEWKSSNKQSRSELLNRNTNSVYQPKSIGVLAHLIENTVCDIINKRLWHLNLTTAYQTMIQVASCATVDYAKNNYSLEQHNPGANAEYWLKQQHQASRMLDPVQANPIAPPNRYDYTTVMEAWVATSKIEQQLQRRRYDPHDLSKHPSEVLTRKESTAMTAVDFGSSVSGTLASIRAGQLIRQWQFLYSSSGNDPRLKPTEAAYSYWLTCIMNSGTDATKSNSLSAARECHSVLQELYNRAEKDGFWPGVRLYNMLMHAYAKAGDAESAENVLQDLIEKAKHNTYCLPDSISFTTVINAWSKMQNQLIAPDRAERLFFLQQDFAMRTGLESLKPTVNTVTVVLQCWARSNHPQANTRVDSILKQMNDLSATGHPQLQPNVITYNTCMGVWAKSVHFDAPSRVENLFQELCKSFERSNFAAWLKPDFVTYFHRMTAWERSSSLTPCTIAEKIDAIFAEIGTKKSSQRPHPVSDAYSLRPNQQLYNIVIRAWSNCGDAVKASRYLDLMLNDYLLENNTEAIPNRHVFHFVMSAWSKQLSFEGAETAEMWLNRMHHLSRSNSSLRGISPNTMSYNTCLGAWARVTQGINFDANPKSDIGIEETILSKATDVPPPSETAAAPIMEMKCLSVISMERGQRLFQRMRECQLPPDQYTYGPLLRMIWAQKKATPQQKYHQARSVIDAMIRDNVPISEFIYSLAAKCGIPNFPVQKRRSAASSTATAKKSSVPTTPANDTPTPVQSDTT